MVFLRSDRYLQGAYHTLMTRKVGPCKILVSKPVQYSMFHIRTTVLSSQYFVNYFQIIFPNMLLVSTSLFSFPTCFRC